MSVSTPAPGHYDEDGVLDFLILWGHGAWNDYDYATVSTSLSSPLNHCNYCCILPTKPL